MSSWSEDFGEHRGTFISAKDFDGEGRELTYVGYKKVVPDDMDFIVGGTQNEKIRDSKGNLVLTKGGEEIKNAYYDPKFPQGYQLLVEFEEGTLSCGSFPCLKELHRVAPQKGDVLHIKRDASVLTATKYFIKKIEVPFSAESQG